MPNDTQQKLVKTMEETQQTLFKLWERWQSEKEYEEIQDYAAPIIPLLTCAKFGRMTKKPFGFTFCVNDINFQMSVKATRTTIKCVIRFM